MHAMAAQGWTQGDAQNMFVRSENLGVLSISLGTESRAPRLCWNVTLQSVQKRSKQKWNQASATKGLMQKILLLASQSSGEAAALVFISKANKKPSIILPLLKPPHSLQPCLSPHPLLSLLAVLGEHEHPCARMSPSLLWTLAWKYHACLSEARSKGLVLWLPLFEWNR